MKRPPLYKYVKEFPHVRSVRQNTYLKMTSNKTHTTQTGQVIGERFINHLHCGWIHWSFTMKISQENIPDQT